VVGVALGVGVADCVGVTFVAVGDGELERVCVGRTLRTGAGALLAVCRGCTGLTCGVGSGVSCDAG
jgi:hypothetical protein